MKTKLLLVEDDQMLAQTICDYCINKNIEVIHLPDGIKGLKAAYDNTLNIIILDVNLPGMDGYTICKRLRKDNIETPIIMLTGRNYVDDVVNGINLGADSYMTKPFHLRELYARMQGLLRRKPSSVKENITIADLTINLARQTVYRDDQLINLRTREFEILKLLVTEPGKLFSRADIIARTEKPGRGVIFEATIDVHISRLRKALGEYEGKPIIETVHGVGYRLGSL